MLGNPNVEAVVLASFNARSKPLDRLCPVLVRPYKVRKAHADLGSSHTRLQLNYLVPLSVTLPQYSNCLNLDQVMALNQGGLNTCAGRCGWRKVDTVHVIHRGRISN